MNTERRKAAEKQIWLPFSCSDWHHFFFLDYSKKMRSACGTASSQEPAAGGQLGRAEPGHAGVLRCFHHSNGEQTLLAGLCAGDAAKNHDPAPSACPGSPLQAARPPLGCWKKENCNYKWISEPGFMGLGLPAWGPAATGAPQHHSWVQLHRGPPPRSSEPPPAALASVSPPSRPQQHPCHAGDCQDTT